MEQKISDILLDIASQEEKRKYVGCAKKNILLS